MKPKLKHPTYETFQRDVAEHELRILHDDGVYRHVQGRNKSGGSVYYFDIVTWPGFLAYTGDMGAFTFYRNEDMFMFFRGNAGDDVHVGYWQEKLVATDRQHGHSVYDEDAPREECLEHLADMEDLSDEERAEIIEQLEDEVFGAESLQEAHDALRDFRFNGKEIFHDTWEWHLTTASYHYVWCCYAIVWAIQQYDAMKTEKQ